MGKKIGWPFSSGAATPTETACTGVSEDCLAKRWDNWVVRSVSKLSIFWLVGNLIEFSKSPVWENRAMRVLVPPMSIHKYMP